MNEEKTFIERMFDDIGDKLKGLAKALCFLGIIACIITAIVMFTSSEEEYFTLGFVYLIVGPLVSWMSSWTIYGLGEVIERVTNIENQSNIKREIDTGVDKGKNANGDTIKKQKFQCTACGAIVYYGEQRCENCGQNFDWSNL